MYSQQRFIMMALDPVHIGTGGYRLGRVDLSIAREPGTNLPKIPGTSLAGAVRSYAAMRYGTPQCAGQGQGDEARGRKGHCARADCPVCYTFGHLKDREGGFAGSVSIADAQLLLFPVYSMAGPLWVSTASRLEHVGFTVDCDDLDRGQCVTTLPGWARPLNLGWLLLMVKEAAPTVAPPSDDLQQTPAWKSMANRLVLLDEGLFSQVVNSNLEVRTSVSIDPWTGAAREGALFTYEALPRASWLWCDVVEDGYRQDGFPRTQARAQDLGHARPLQVVESGLQLAEYLGVGGMGTRGFGRIKLMAQWEVSCG